MTPTTRRAPTAGPGGLPAADAFLKSWVPRITASPAFRRDGLLAILFDGAEDDSSACCSEQPGPNTPAPGGQSGGPGGGRTGAVLLSRFNRPGTVTGEACNHYRQPAGPGLVRRLRGGNAAPRRAPGPRFEDEESGTSANDVPRGPFGAPCAVPPGATSPEAEWGPLRELARASGFTLG